MATTSTLPDNLSPEPPARAASVLVTLSALSADALNETLSNIAAAFADQTVDVATVDAVPANLAADNLRIASYTPSVVATGSWVHTAADFINTYQLMKDHNAACCLLLGPEAQSIHPQELRALADSISYGRVDLVTPDYALGPHEGLVNSAILYPVTRALFGIGNRYPLSTDLGLSMRMAQRLAASAQRLPFASEGGALMWPISEAAIGNFVTDETAISSRVIPQPTAIDLNSLLAQVAGSFFADIDAKARNWQRARVAPPQGMRTEIKVPSAERPAVDIQSMVDSFHLAYTNLHEIWSLVLPPNSLLGLKKLSVLPLASFRMPDPLWTRIVYDFVLAYRLRTINRGHLMGALTPLYLAWVASHLLLTSGETSDTMAPEKHIEQVATAFENDKAYLVARWRWPDRFNP